MATKRLPMRKTKDILRLKWALCRTHRETAESLNISSGTVGLCLSRAKAEGLCSWEAVCELSDAELEERLYGRAQTAGSKHPLPDPAQMHTELKRPGVTLELLHLEYLQAHPDGYRYTAFCGHYRKWLKQRGWSMRQRHKAGDKAFVDYSGKKPCIVDPKTGEVIPVELFVCVLGASNFTYAEATRSQKSFDFIASHNRALEHFGGVPAAVVPDQLKSGVTTACRYEPALQRTYQEWAAHYQTCVLPARPRKPKDKAKVEVAVQVVQRWILARLRHETFFSLEALNMRISELLEDLNDRPMKVYGNKSRRQLFETIDRPALKPLPVERFIYGTWKVAKINIDYHIDVAGHYYSVPHTTGRIHVEVRTTARTVEIYHKGNRIASHRRSHRMGSHTTIAEHMPKAHRAHLEWTPTRLIAWAEKIGPYTAALVEHILMSRPHPEQGYRSCLGLLRLSKRYDALRLDAACKRAGEAGAQSYRHVASILKHSLECSTDDEAPTRRPHIHQHIRGKTYYQQGDSDHAN